MATCHRLHFGCARVSSVIVKHWRTGLGEQLARASTSPLWSGSGTGVVHAAGHGRRLDAGGDVASVDPPTASRCLLVDRQVDRLATLTSFSGFFVLFRPCTSYIRRDRHRALLELRVWIRHRGAGSCGDRVGVGLTRSFARRSCRVEAKVHWNASGFGADAVGLLVPLVVRIS